MRNLILFLATGAGSGYSPIAPGTLGSIVGTLLFALLALQLQLAPAALWVALALLTLVGIWSADRAEQIFARKDDGRITIDELAGVWTALIALPVRADVLIAGFVLFRIFDIWKPFPVRWFESLGGGVGIVTDDLVAGLYANVVGQVLWRLLLPGGLG